MKYTFSKEYHCCPLDTDERLNLTHVEATGSCLDDLLDNAMISLEDWHGNQGPDWDLGDLSDREVEMITRDMGEFLADHAFEKAKSIRKYGE